MTAPAPGASEPPAAAEAPSSADGLVQLSFLIHGILERRARGHDLSIIQMRLLGVLRDRVPAMNELARFLDLDKSSITGLIDRAQRRGLVVRVPSTTDRRAVLVSLTDHGRSLVSAGAARVDADISLLLEHLPPPDRGALSRLISQLLISHETEQGIDLLATISPANPEAASATSTHR